MKRAKLVVPLSIVLVALISILFVSWRQTDEDELANRMVQSVAYNKAFDILMQLEQKLVLKAERNFQNKKKRLNADDLHAIQNGEGLTKKQIDDSITKLGYEPFDSLRSAYYESKKIAMAEFPEYKLLTKDQQIMLLKKVHLTMRSNRHLHVPEF